MRKRARQLDRSRITTPNCLQQMTLLCQTVQNLGKQMQEGFEAERTRRQQDFEIESQKTRDDSNNMESTMAAKMEEGFRNEQQARQQARKERMKGLKNEENCSTNGAARLKDNQIKEKIRQLGSGSGSGSTVGSDARKAVGTRPSGTFARPPPGFGNRSNEWFIPRKSEFKGWVTDYQGLTDTEFSDFIGDSQIPKEC